MVALAYHKKTENFMEQYDLSEFCIPDSELNAERLISVFQKLCSSVDVVGQRQFDKSCQIGEVVRKDFRNMLSKFNPKVK